MNMCACSIAELARLIRTKSVSCKEIVQAHLNRIEQVNPRLNAVVQLRAQAALLEAEQADIALAHGQSIGPLHGIPMTIKDSFDCRDLISSAGTLGRAKFVPTEDAIVVARLRKAGAILLGKSNTPELTIAYETDNLVYGRTANPHNTWLSAGGSSGGAAAIIAAGGASFDIGSDTGGSIRLPAHFCGIAGLKPTQGRVPRTGHIISALGFLQALTHVGPLARTVDDLALLLPIIAGPDGCDPHTVDITLPVPSKVEISTLRIAFYSAIGEVQAHPEITEKIEQAAIALEETGARVAPAAPACLPNAYELYYQLFHADGNAWVRELLTTAGTDRNHPFLDWAHQTRSTAKSGRAFAALLARWDHFRAEMLAFMRQHDVILCPVHSHPAFVHGSSKKPPYRAGFAFTIVYNLTGWPAAVVCIGKTTEGEPIGIQIVAAPWREDLVLAAAGYLESVFGGWRANKPAI